MEENDPYLDNDSNNKQQIVDVFSLEKQNSIDDVNYRKNNQIEQSSIFEKLGQSAVDS